MTGVTTGAGAGAKSGTTATARPGARRVITAIALVRAGRPKQWLKNLLVLAAPIAAGLITEGPVLVKALVAFVAFCLASSGLYLVNDVVDAECDRLHPVKCGRPIAAGLVSPRAAMITAAVLIVIAEGIGAWLGYRFAIVLTVFVGVVLAYSYRLKRYPLVDILAVAAGFVLRAVAGSAATGIQDSEWFLLLVSLGALFVVTGKRYADVRTTLDPGARSGAMYNALFLLYLAFGLAAASVAAYVLWVFFSPAGSLGVLISLSIIPFALAVGRYAQLVALKRGGTPEDLFIKDKILKFAMLVWLLMYGGGIYVFS